MSKHEAEFKNFMAELTLKILKAASEKYKTTEQTSALQSTMDFPWAK